MTWMYLEYITRRTANSTLHRWALPGMIVRRHTRLHLFKALERRVIPMLNGSRWPIMLGIEVYCPRQICSISLEHTLSTPEHNMMNIDSLFRQSHRWQATSVFWRWLNEHGNTSNNLAIGLFWRHCHGSHETLKISESPWMDFQPDKLHEQFAEWTLLRISVVAIVLALNHFQTGNAMALMLSIGVARTSTSWHGEKGMKLSWKMYLALALLVLFLWPGSNHVDQVPSCRDMDQLTSRVLAMEWYGWNNSRQKQQIDASTSTIHHDIIVQFTLSWDSNRAFRWGANGAHQSGVGACFVNILGTKTKQNGIKSSQNQKVENTDVSTMSASALPICSLRYPEMFSS